MIHKFSEIADGFSGSHSLTRDHREVGFSLGISAEKSMTRWLKHVPLLNPVQISKFLVWKRFSECPPGLFFSQHVDLLSGRRSVREFPSRFPNEEQRIRLFTDSVELVTQFVLDKRVLTLSEIAEATVARTARGAANSVRRLVRRGLARITSEYGKTFARLTSAGQESVFDLTEAWQLLCNQNFRILPLKSYELAANGEKAPRNAEVGQQTLTLASSACSYNEEAPESARLKIQVSETGLAVKTRSAHSQVQILPSAPKSLKHKYALARNRYKPPKVNVLLIAESPPTSGGYFYSERTIGKDHLFRETMKALEFWPQNRPMRKGCDKRPMLKQFRSAGFFLIDTCELPIDNLKSRRRRISTIQGALTLPHRVRELDPHRILIVKKTVFKPAAQALSDAGFGDKILNARPLPFPSHGNQSKFRTMMIRLLNRTDHEGG